VKLLIVNALQLTARSSPQYYVLGLGFCFNVF